MYPQDRTYGGRGITGGRGRSATPLPAPYNLASENSEARTGPGRRKAWGHSGGKREVSGEVSGGKPEKEVGARKAWGGEGVRAVMGNVGTAMSKRINDGERNMSNGSSRSMGKMVVSNDARVLNGTLREESAGQRSIPTHHSEGAKVDIPNQTRTPSSVQAGHFTPTPSISPPPTASVTLSSSNGTAPTAAATVSSDAASTIPKKTVQNDAEEEKDTNWADASGTLDFSLPPPIASVDEPAPSPPRPQQLEKAPERKAWGAGASGAVTLLAGTRGGATGGGLLRGDILPGRYGTTECDEEELRAVQQQKRIMREKAEAKAKQKKLEEDEKERLRREAAKRKLEELDARLAERNEERRRKEVLQQKLAAQEKSSGSGRPTPSEKPVPAGNMSVSVERGPNAAEASQTSLTAPATQRGPPLQGVHSQPVQTLGRQSSYVQVSKPTSDWQSSQSQARPNSHGQTESPSQRQYQRPSPAQPAHDQHRGPHRGLGRQQFQSQGDPSSTYHRQRYQQAPHRQTYHRSPYHARSQYQVRQAYQHENTVNRSNRPAQQQVHAVNSQREGSPPEASDLKQMGPSAADQAPSGRRSPENAHPISSPNAKSAVEVSSSTSVSRTEKSSGKPEGEPVPEKPKKLPEREQSTGAAGTTHKDRTTGKPEERTQEEQVRTSEPSVSTSSFPSKEEGQAPRILLRRPGVSNQKVGADGLHEKGTQKNEKVKVSNSSRSSKLPNVAERRSESKLWSRGSDRGKGSVRDKQIPEKVARRKTSETSDGATWDTKIPLKPASFDEISRAFSNQNETPPLKGGKSLPPVPVVAPLPPQPLPPQLPAQTPHLVSEVPTPSMSNGKRGKMDDRKHPPRIPLGREQKKSEEHRELMRRRKARRLQQKEIAHKRRLAIAAKSKQTSSESVRSGNSETKREQPAESKAKVAEDLLSFVTPNPSSDSSSTQSAVSSLKVDHQKRNEKAASAAQNVADSYEKNETKASSGKAARGSDLVEEGRSTIRRSTDSEFERGSDPPRRPRQGRSWRSSNDNGRGSGPHQNRRQKSAVGAGRNGKSTSRSVWQVKSKQQSVNGKEQRPESPKSIAENARESAKNPPRNRVENMGPKNAGESIDYSEKLSSDTKKVGTTEGGLSLSSKQDDRPGQGTGSGEAKHEDERPVSKKPEHAKVRNRGPGARRTGRFRVRRRSVEARRAPGSHSDLKAESSAKSENAREAEFSGAPKSDKDRASTGPPARENQHAINERPVVKKAEVGAETSGSGEVVSDRKPEVMSKATVEGKAVTSVSSRDKDSVKPGTGTKGNYGSKGRGKRGLRGRSNDRGNRGRKVIWKKAVKSSSDGSPKEPSDVKAEASTSV